MQIHELTSRRPTNEGLGAMIKGVADVAGRSVMQKYGGTSGGTYGPTLSGSAAQSAAGQMSGQLIDKMGQQMQTNWLKQALPTLMQASGATEPAEIDPQDQIEELTKLVNQNLKFDYSKPGVAAGGRAGAEAAQRVKEISAAITSITKHPPPGSGKAKSAGEYQVAFKQLANAMAALINLSTFQSGTTKVAGGSPDLVSNAILKTLGTTPAEAAAFGAAVNNSGPNSEPVKPTGNPMLDAFLKAAKVIK